MRQTELKSVVASHGLWLACGDGSRADLTRADLRGSDLRGTCLEPGAPIPSITDETIADAGMVVDGALVRGYRTARSQRCGNADYSRPGEYRAPVFSVAKTECHPGIYLAGKEWLRQEYQEVLLVACHCLRTELHHAGNKWRAKRIWVEEMQR